MAYGIVRNRRPAPFTGARRRWRQAGPHNGRRFSSILGAECGHESGTRSEAPGARPLMRRSAREPGAIAILRFTVLLSLAVAFAGRTKSAATESLRLRAR